MSVLDDIRAKIGSAFSDPGLFFSDCTLTRARGGSGWNDETEGATAYPCKAMLSSYNDHLRAVADIPGTDAKMLIICTSISVDPLKGDTVTLVGKGWAVIDVKVDPAQAMWVCQVRPL